ncbi:WD40-repeat-containing domain protein [Syncephalastrum racemosum]|uniref:WD40-repeat-containing domain protein n=1 Tax=Syncephalastrum racemosum TaxID=13706 RepID=A0A1X2HKP3_SYNRA|nr:WD40-repeat-containing domain protein [Syncephalastrum racemosum]
MAEESFKDLSVPLTLDRLRDLDVNKVFNGSSGPTSSTGFNVNKGGAVTSTSFTTAGDMCVTSGQDESINVYDCVSGQHMTTLYSKKYGVNLARFTHHNKSIIYASTKEDDTLRYLSIHDNKFIRYFRGHTKRVTQLQMAPKSDIFMSVSLDGTARLWDLRSSTCHGVVPTSTDKRPTGAFDPAGMIFAIGLGTDTMKLYDLRAFSKGPFSTFNIADQFYYPQGLPEWSRLQFTNDGTNILLSTAGHTHYIVDSFEGTVKQRLSGHGTPPSDTCGEQITITPNDQFVLSASHPNQICAWDLKNPKTVDAPIQDNVPCHKFDTPHRYGPVRALGFNPTHLMMVSASEEVALWTPADPTSLM